VLRSVAYTAPLTQGLAWLLLAVAGFGWSQPSIAAVQPITVRVQVDGVTGAAKTNVLAFLSIYQRTRQTSLEVTPDRLQRWHRLAKQQFQQALQPFGYYQAQVTSTLLEPVAATKKGVGRQQWQAHYQISLGPRTRLTQVSIDVSGSGAQLVAVQTQVQLLREQQGQWLDHQLYSRVKAQLLSDLYAAGYLDGAFTLAKLQIDPASASAKVNWQLNTGPRYEFGPITIDQRILRESFVARYHNILPGQPFETDRLIALQLRLNDSNYFRQVSLDIQRDRAVGLQIPVVLRAESAKARRYSAGVGFGTDTGPRTSAGIETRRVNDRGHRFRLNTRLSTISQELQFEYDIPIKTIASDRWRLFATAARAEVGDADTRVFAVGAAREDSWGVFRRRLFATLERENFEIGSAGQQTATLFYPGVTLAYDRLDDPLFVRRGFSLSATLLAGSQALGSDVDFVTARFSGRGVLGLAPRWRLLAGLELAALETDDFSQLPPSQRLYAGGDRSVRGYGFQEISPQNAAGDDIGGRYLASASMEVDYQIRGPWGMAAFVDAGDVGNSSLGNFEVGIGLGLRYRSPVGMIRFDLAHPLDDPNMPVRIHVSIGPDL